MSDQEILMVQKATMYDLKRIFEADPSKTYSVDELKKIIDSYITGVEQ